MHRTDWAVVGIAVVSSALYVAWVVAFERGLEPLARRLVGSIIGRPIGWVPAGVFRIWGSGEAGHVPRERTIALLGTLLVLASAAMPVVVLHFVAAWLEERERIRASAYLMTVPLMAVFVVRVLGRQAKGG